IRSSSTPPNIIAPSRPLPNGDDSVKFFAGASNQIVVSDGMDLFSAANKGSANVNVKTEIQNKTPVFFIIKFPIGRSRIKCDDAGLDGVRTGGHNSVAHQLFAG